MAIITDDVKAALLLAHDVLVLRGDIQLAPADQVDAALDAVNVVLDPLRASKSPAPDLAAVDRQMAEKEIDPLRLAIARENLLQIDWQEDSENAAGYAVSRADALLAELRKGGR